MKTFSFILLSVVAAMLVIATPAPEQRLKMALPDGVFPEDKLAHQRIQHPSKQEGGVTSIVPMIIMEEDDFAPTSSASKPLYKHQVKNHVQKKKGYKHLGAASNERSFRPMLVTPLLPKDQQDAKQEAIKQQKEVTEKQESENNMRSKKLIAVSDKGIYQPIDLPIPQKAPDTKEIEEQVLPQGVSENRIVVLDKTGKMKFIDIPYYNRASFS